MSRTIVRNVRPDITDFQSASSAIIRDNPATQTATHRIPLIPGSFNPRKSKFRIPPKITIDKRTFKSYNLIKD